MTYQKQTWQSYDENQTESENKANGGVITADRMNHIEDGIGAAEIGGALPRIYLEGDTSKMTGDVAVPLSFTYEDGKRTIVGTTNTKWQGDSSELWSKKNYKLKLYK
ncbi:MAG: hypothetical protein ABF456_07855, partial [Lacticaseibacillus paracasei]